MKGLFTAYFSLFAVLACLAQQKDPADALESYFEENYKEKALVITDKDIYFPGDMVWVKNHILDADNKASRLSKVAYVEIIGADSSVVVQGKIDISEGRGSGSFVIPYSAQSGDYFLRTYTKWMQNDGADQFYQKAIKILNPASSASRAGGAQAGLDIRFFPEGGNVSSGHVNRIAYRITDSDGRRINFRGAVINAANDTLLRFQPRKNGLGTFDLHVSAGENYRAVIDAGGGRITTTDLPSASAQAYSIYMTPGAQSLGLKVASSSQSDAVRLVGHNNKKVVYSQVKALQSSQTVFEVNRSLLPEGITLFTVFDSRMRPVAERLYFTRPKRQLQISVQTPSQTYPVRSRVDVDLRSWLNASPAQLEMSLAVVKKDLVDSSSDIFSELWLGSEIKGHVEGLQEILEAGDAEADQTIDDLMLTHGWRRFKWQNTQGVTSREYLPEVQGHIITGTVSDMQTGKPAAGVMTFLSVPSRRTQIYSSKSDQEGRVRFFTREMFGPGEIVVQTDAAKDTTYSISIDDPYSKENSGFSTPIRTGSGTTRSALLDYLVSTQVENAFAGSRRMNYISPVVDSSSFYGKADFHYKLDDYVRFRTTEEVLREYVPSVVLLRQRDNFNMIVDKRTTFGPVPLVPLIIYDGVPVFDRGNRVIAVNPDKIRELEVLTKTSFLGDTSFASIVSFRSFRANLDGIELNPRDLVMDYEGLQLQREFFSPDYRKATEGRSRIPDQRTVLHWDPRVITDSKGQSRISFYTSDEPGIYRLIVQGITADGHAGSGVIEFEVK